MSTIYSYGNRIWSFGNDDEIESYLPMPSPPVPLRVEGGNAGGCT